MRHHPRVGLVAEVVRGAFHLFSEVETSGLEPPTPCLQIVPGLDVWGHMGTRVA